MQPTQPLQPRSTAADRQATQAGPPQGIARVVDLVDAPSETILLDVIDGPAVRAASCALVPSVGDRVWFVRQGDECFVTAVLTRAQPDAPARVQYSGDVQMSAGGTLRLSGQDVSVHAKDEVAVEGAALRVGVQRARAVIGEVSTFAKSVVNHVARTSIVGSVLEHVVDRFASHTRSSVRTVDGMDQLSARDFDHRASGSASMSGEHTFIHGRAIVKADGDQIHLG